MVVKPRKPKRVVALKGRPSFTLKVHVNSNLYASEWLQDLPYMWSYTHQILEKRNYIKEGFLWCHDKGALSHMKHCKPSLTNFYQQTRNVRKKIYGIPPLFVQETKSKSMRWSTLMYSLLRLIYLLKNGVTRSYYTTFRITDLALSAETETWLISSHLYQKCAFTALELRETMLQLTDIFFFYIFKLAVLALFLSAKFQRILYLRRGSSG